MKQEVAKEMTERKKKPELRNLKRWTWLEIILWLALIPLYIVTDNWAAAILVLVIISKTWFIYQFRKLLLELQVITDSILDILKKASEKSDSKPQQRRKTAMKKAK